MVDSKQANDRVREIRSQARARLQQMRAERLARRGVRAATRTNPEDGFSAAIGGEVALEAQASAMEAPEPQMDANSDTDLAAALPAEAKDHEDEAPGKPDAAGPISEADAPKPLQSEFTDTADAEIGATVDTASDLTDRSSMAADADLAPAADDSDATVMDPPPAGDAFRTDADHREAEVDSDVSSNPSLTDDAMPKSDDVMTMEAADEPDVSHAPRDDARASDETSEDQTRSLEAIDGPTDAGTSHGSQDDPACDLHLLPGAGPGLVWMLQEAGIRSLGDLAATEELALAAKLGVVGEVLDLTYWIDFAKRSITQDVAAE